MDIKTVGVLGCGLMGAGIAQVAAASGHRTIVGEVNQKALDRGLARIGKFLEDGITRGKVTPEERDKIFTKMSRAENARLKVTDGTGLGLYIVREAITALGGQIGFSSELDRGTIFTANIPNGAR